MNKNNSSLLVIGSVALDSIKTPFGEVKDALGGSATYISLSGSIFAPTSLVAVVGEDFTDQLKKPLLRANIDSSGLITSPGKTFRWGGEYNFDLNTRQTLFTELGVFADFKPQLSKQQKNAQFVFLGNTHPSIQHKVIKQLKQPKFVGLDTMNFWIEKTPRELKAVLKMVDALIINDSEARELSQEYNILKAAKKIQGFMHKSKKRILIIKRGEYGLLLFQHGKIFHLPGFPLEEVLDPTGAGDTFAGGFMGFLASQKNISWENIKKAAVCGSAMASFCVEKFGTLALQNLNKNKLQSRLKHFKVLTGF